METYIIYTTKNGSYIVPKAKAKLPKHYTHSYEIDSPVPICTRRCKLAAKVETMEAVSGLLCRLTHGFSDEEIAALKKDLGIE